MPTVVPTIQKPKHSKSRRFCLDSNGSWQNGCHLSGFGWQKSSFSFLGCSQFKPACPVFIRPFSIVKLKTVGILILHLTGTRNGPKLNGHQMASEHCTLNGPIFKCHLYTGPVFNRFGSQYKRGHLKIRVIKVWYSASSIWITSLLLTWWNNKCLLFVLIMGAVGWRQNWN